MAFLIPLRAKYTTSAVAKSTRTKGGGNSGGVGRRAVAHKRGHGGGQETTEQKEAQRRQSMAFLAWRASWGSPDCGRQPG